MNENTNSAPQPGVPESKLEGNVKLLSALGYLGILFLVPYLVHPQNRYAVFHANQGLVLLIAAFAGGVVSGVIPIIGWLILGPIVSLTALVFAIMGIVNALNGRMKRLPLIGNFDLLKVQDNAPVATPTPENPQSNQDQHNPENNHEGGQQ